MSELPEHVAANREYWDDMADQWVEMGERAWARDAPTWGEWGIPEAEIGMLPEDMSGMQAIELGCGTGYVSAWMARRGATVTAIDNSAKQLATARRLADEHGIELELIHGNAETVPKPDGSYDFAVSEYGASIWADPYKWIPEAHRLLKPGAALHFLGNHIVLAMCWPPDGSFPVSRTLEISYFDIYRQDWRDAVDDPGGIEFNLTFSGWIRLFNDTGLEIVDLIEVQAPEDVERDRAGVPAEWAKQWPSEHIWKLRKRR